MAYVLNNGSGTNGLPQRGLEGDSEAGRLRQDIDRVRTSSALRRLVFAAAACDSAAGAAANAAGEISQLRHHARQSFSREERRADLDRDKEQSRDKAEQSLAAKKRADEALQAHQRFKLNRHKNQPEAFAQDIVQDAVGREAERREAAQVSAEARELSEALAKARSELAAARLQMEVEAEVWLPVHQSQTA
jgi:hypothetical protein